MNYPEKGAKYRNEPAWLDRAKRAEGGSATTPFKPSPGSPFLPLQANSGDIPTPKDDED